MEKIKESTIEEVLREQVKKLGGLAYKFVSPGNDGVPDRIVIFPGKTPIFVELKTDTGKLSRLQRVQIDRLQKLGQQVEVVRGMRGLKQFFEGQGYMDAASWIATRFDL